MEFIESIWRSIYESMPATFGFLYFMLIAFVLVLFFLISVAGCIIPVLPGPIIAFLAVLILRLTIASNLLSWTSVIICLALALITQVFDYWLPVKYTPTRAGAIGAFVGAFAGFFVSIIFPPLVLFAIFLGPMLCAFAFEYSSNANFKRAWQSGKGAFLGTIISVFAKIFVIFAMIVLVLTDIIVSI